MLGIRIDNQLIDLFANTQIGFELNSPIFLSSNTDVLPGSYSFPFSVPASTNNRAIFGAAEAVDNADPFLVKENAEIYVDGLLLFTATAYFKSASPDVYQVFLIVNSLENLKEVKLNEIDLGGDRDIGPDAPAHAKLTAQNPESYDYAFFPVYNPSFWDPEQDPDGFGNLSQIQNPYDSFNQVFREEDDALIAMPFVRLDYLLTQIFAGQNLAIQNDFQTITELQRLYVYNNYSIYTQDGEWSTTINLQNHVSENTAAEFIKGVGKDFCLGFFYSPFTKKVRVVPLKDLLTENHSHNWTAKAARDYTLSIDRSFPGIFCYKSSVDLSESDLLEFPVEVLDEVMTVADAEGAGGPGYYYIISTNSYRYIPQPASPPPDFIYDKKTSICKDTDYNDDLLESQVGTLYMDEITYNLGTEDFPVFRYNFGPYIKCPGTFPPRNQKYEMPDKLIFYRGMQLNDFIEFYPFASNNIYDHNANTLPGVQYSLLWDREEGLYNQWWKDFHTLLQNMKEVDRLLKLNIVDLLNFSFDQKVRIENMDYFVKQLTISIGQNGLEPVQAKLVSVA